MEIRHDHAQIQPIAVELGYSPHIPSRGVGVQHSQVGQRSRRPVVARTHRWANRFRGLLIRWVKKAKNHVAFLHPASGLITWRIIGLLR